MHDVISLDLPLRGARSYIHGTDIYEAIVSRLAADPHGESGLSMSIHQFSRHGLDMLVARHASDPLPEHAAVTFHNRSGLRGVMIETERPVGRTIPFDENAITSHVEVSGNEASITGKTGLPPIDVLVILTKHWHLTQLPEAGKAWVFVRLDLDRLLTDADAERLSIRIDQNLANRMTRAAVLSAGQPIGHIYFSKVKPH